MGNHTQKITVICLLLIAACYARDTYSIEGEIALPPKPYEKPEDIKIMLTDHIGNIYYTIPCSSGAFQINDVGSGTYLLNILSVQYVFDSVKLEIKSGKVRARTVNDTSVAIPYPLELRAIGRPNYFQEKIPYNFAGILQNPMIIMGGFTVIMSFALPKLMANMDPETLKEMQGGAEGNTGPTFMQQVSDWKPPSIEYHRR
eukprot:TRINITY_DN1350_c0_g1_i1.p1 TRINITY_DN1350_c0_g1~~TRINITY_DN1350_c0_g1_i1.p1  ORF type:complete len:201 (-),score=44.13 TRINITY_DN1350_c0_g1_i1:4-606(-)